MPLRPLISAGIEGVLNRFLWKEVSLKPARQRLYGKVLRVEISEFSTPLILAFSEQQLDVLSQWEGQADCTVITRLGALSELRDRTQLTALIRRGDLEVQGDLPVVQNLVSLIDLAEFDPTEWIAPYVGDIAAETLSKVLRHSGNFFKKTFDSQRRYLAEAVVEEWCLAPGHLEVAWFSEETIALASAVDALNKRLDKLEGQ